MKHWKRHILATFVCIIGCAAIAIAVVVSYLFLIQPDVERPSDITLPMWARSIVSFLMVFCAVYFSSLLLPPDSRQYSALISGSVLVFVLLAVIVLCFGLAQVFALLTPLALDMIPFAGGILLSWYLHARKRTNHALQ